MKKSSSNEIENSKPIIHMKPTINTAKTKPINKEIPVKLDSLTEEKVTETHGNLTSSQIRSEFSRWKASSKLTPIATHPNSMSTFTLWHASTERPKQFYPTTSGSTKYNKKN